MPRILVIDDDDVIRALFGETMEEAGYEVDLARNGVDGIRLFREKSPDLVITDLFMPEKDGIETIVELRRDFPDTKIIAVSGRHMAGGKYLEISQTLGADRVLLKPVKVDELLYAVKELIREKSE